MDKNNNTNQETEVRELEFGFHDFSDEIDFDALEEEISELISDRTGFCHYGFEYKIVVKAKLDISE